MPYATWMRFLLAALVSLPMAAAARCSLAQDGPAPQRVISLNKIPTSDRAGRQTDPTSGPPAPPSPHPLVPALKIAYDSYEFLDEQVKDYSCRMVKRERISGYLRPYEYIDAKVRHDWRVGGRQVHPRSVYLKFIAPESRKGREILWVQGQNNDNMVVRRGGRRFEYVTVEVSPDNEAVLRESRYSVTDTGMKTMVRRLIEIGVADLKYGECEVKFFRDVTVDDRKCTCIQVKHPRKRDEFTYHLARIFVDDEYPVPIRFEAYDWPESEGGEPLLIEEYTFQNLRLNVGFSDAEFRRDYAEYGFRN